MKIKQALKQIEEEKGPFQIKSLVARDPAYIQWDLVLSAEWFGIDPTKQLDYLCEKILRDFDSDCMTEFSGIVTYGSNVSNPLIEALQVIQENHRLGNYGQLIGGDYIADRSHGLIIPLNDSEAKGRKAIGRARHVSVGHDVSPGP
jgi:hypothetical protein